MRLNLRFGIHLTFLFVAIAVGLGTQTTYRASMNLPTLAIAQADPNPTPTSMSYPIKHVVVIIQENRTVDNLFNGYCAPNGQCADTVITNPVTLATMTPQTMGGGSDIPHIHTTFVNQYDSGKMDGASGSAMHYAPSSETTFYVALASQGVLADEVFQMNQGPSFPAHQYLIAGQSGGSTTSRLAVADNPNSFNAANCGSGTTPLKFLPMNSDYPGVEQTISQVPCFEYRTVFDQAGAQGLTWRYYVDVADNIWAGPNAVNHIYNGSMGSSVVTPSKQVLTDITGWTCAGGGSFPSVVFITPPRQDSDHPSFETLAQAGPYWVSTIVNKIVAQPNCWQNTAIIVVWDDWGGWYDHVPPPVTFTNPYESGFRVPLFILSAYSKVGIVDHTQRTAAAILRFTEDVLGLQTLGTLDVQSDDLMVDFNMLQTPAPSPSPVPVPTWTP